MELRHLRYFAAVAEMENVSRAATQKLHVSQTGPSADRSATWKTNSMCRYSSASAKRLISLTPAVFS
jgi:hypothetical protein